VLKLLQSPGYSVQPETALWVGQVKAHLNPAVNRHTQIGPGFLVIRRMEVLQVRIYRIENIETDEIYRGN
jgi:hypothetical protein